MRPRLSEPEVWFLLELLEPKRKEAEERYGNSFSRLEPERNQLWTFLERVSRGMTVYDKEGIEQKRQRLDIIQKEIDSNRNQMTIFQGLCVRFQDLLGHKKRGRLKLESDMARHFITKQMEPEGMKELAPKETTDLVELATARAWGALTESLNNHAGQEPEVPHRSTLPNAEPNAVVVLPTPDSSGDLYDSFIERLDVLSPCARSKATPQEPSKEEPDKQEPKRERKKPEPKNSDGKIHFNLIFGN